MRLWSIAGAIFVVTAICSAAPDYPLNQQPMYGGVAKTPEMLKADQEFIEAVLNLGYTRAIASDEAVKKGWAYFRQNDFAAAIKRFNQAWLLDPDNGDAFHGFAVVVMARDNDAAKADEMFKTGIAKPRQSPGIYPDYGRFLLLQNRPAEAVLQLRKALTFADMGPDAQAMLIGALAQSGDWVAACQEAKKPIDGAQKPYVEAVQTIRAECAKRTPQ